MKRPPSRTAPSRSLSSGRKGPYCAAGLKSGIRATARASLLGRQPGPARAPAQEEPAGEEKRRGDDGVVDEAEVVVEALVAPPERPSGSGEGEAPGRRADRRQAGVAPERHA